MATRRRPATQLETLLAELRTLAERIAAAERTLPNLVGLTRKASVDPAEGTKMSYPSDLTDEEWALVEPYLRTPRAHGGRPVRHDPRRLLDGILYVSDNANKWRALPQDFPRWTVVYAALRRWSKRGVWARLQALLPRARKKKNGRESAPSVLLLDSQSARSVYGGEAIGIDGGKRVRGRKRSVLSDVDGVVVAMRIDAANRHDVAIAREWLPEVLKTMPTVRVIKADGGYDNPRLRAQLAAHGVELQAQKLCGADGSFQPVDGRWRIEQCFGVLRHARRQVREFERSTWAAQAMCMLAALRLELRRLCNNVRLWDQVTV